VSELLRAAPSLRCSSSQRYTCSLTTRSGAWLFFALGVLELVIATVAWRGGSPLALDPPAAYGWIIVTLIAESHA
jgi:hypothetical protein